MKNSEIKELTTKELIERIDETKTLMIRLRMNHAVSPLENPLKIKATRRDIARMKTELNVRNQNQNK